MGTGSLTKAISGLFRVKLQTPETSRLIECGATEFLWNAAARAGIVLPSICHQGRCLTCASRLVEGEVDQTASASYYEQDRDSGFILPCTALPKSDLIVQTHQADAMRLHRKTLGLPAPYS